MLEEEYTTIRASPNKHKSQTNRSEDIYQKRVRVRIGKAKQTNEKLSEN